MYSDKITCIDGPLEGQTISLDRRLFRLYDTIIVPETEIKYFGKRGIAKLIPTGAKYKYIIKSEGLYHVG